MLAAKKPKSVNVHSSGPADVEQLISHGNKLVYAFFILKT